jgi:CHAD domain-containing protein
MSKSSNSGSDPGASYGDAMREMIATRWAITWNAIPPVLAGNDPAAVHDLRVASRRLRAAMDVSTSCFPRKWYRPLHKQAKAITRSTGAVRDGDVLLAALISQSEHASDEMQPGLAHLIRELDRERTRARAAMLRYLLALDSGPTRKQTRRRFKRSSNLRKSETDTPAPPAPLPDGEMDDRAMMRSLDPAATLATNARLALAVRTADLFGHAGVIPDPTAIEPLHDARISAKRLRYTLELFPRVFGEEGAYVIRQLQALQEALGHLHDCDVRMQRIEDELTRLAGQPDAGELRLSLDLLLSSERTARAIWHASVVEQWQEMERAQVQATLLRLAGMTAST